MRVAYVLVLTAFAVILPGCSPAKVEVVGRVTYNGSPLNVPGGKIVFVGPDSAQCAATINVDGTYRAVGVSAGRNRVAIFYPNPQFKPRKRGARGEPPEDPLPSIEPFLIPAKYASADNSELSVQAAAGTVFDPELTGPEIE
jgi:hypothetical protein